MFVLHKALGFVSMELICALMWMILIMLWLWSNPGYLIIINWHGLRFVRYRFILW